MVVYFNLIHNNQNLETSQMSFKVRMVKQTVLSVCVYKMEYQSAMKRNEQFIYMQQLQ